MSKPAEFERRPTLSLPWTSRNEGEWRELFTKKEVSRLFFLASRKDGQALDNQWINRWHLQTALAAFWQNDFLSLEESLRDTRDIKPADFNKQQVVQLVEDTAEIFDDQKIFTFLRIASKIHRKRDPAVNIYQAAASRLGLENLESQQLVTNYQKLVEVFLPLTTRFAVSKLAKFGVGREEARAIGGLKTSLGVLNFYWETYTLDSEWTIGCFLKSFWSSLQNPTSQRTDTTRLETPIDPNLFMDASPSADDIVIALAENIAMMDLIKSAAPSEKAQRAVALRVFYSYSNQEIAEEIGVVPQTVTRYFVEFRDRLRRLALKGEIDLRLPPKRGLKDSPTWNWIFANLEALRTNYFEKGGRLTLPPFFRDVVDALFQAQTGEKETTIDAVRRVLKEEKNRAVERNTVKRVVPRGVIWFSKLTDPQEKNPRKYLERYQEATTAKQLLSAPETASLFSTTECQIFELYYLKYLEDPDHPLTAKEIAKVVKRSESNVSRALDRFRQISVREAN